ncbi:MAG TPA: hypothetical protein VNN62_04530 [Methylomirabilota bacterium]|jgi:hypothetical protein|nr:hypothetical protein [Methylomirabilota bacterium]
MGKELKGNSASQGESVDRRGFMRTAGAVAAGFAAAGFATGVARAQGGGRLPLNTPIEKLGFNAAELNMLTPNDKKLTKGDLFALQEWARTRQGNPPAHLTIADINALEQATQSMQKRQHAPGAMQSEDVTACCSCCPCCTCTAASVVQPVRQVA